MFGRLLLLFCAAFVRADDPVNEYEMGFHFAPQPPGIVEAVLPPAVLNAPPRAISPAKVRRLPPAHEPMTYAALHGVSLETDEEGTLRVGGQAQEGYESLYFDPAATSTTGAPMAPVDDSNILVKKRVSRSSEGSQEAIRRVSFHNTTHVVVQPLEVEEGSGEDISVDRADESSQPLVGLRTEGVSFVWNQETARRADLRKEGTANYDRARQDINRKSGDVMVRHEEPPPNKRITISIRPSKKPTPRAEKGRSTAKIGSTAIVRGERTTGRSNRVGGTADLRGTSRRGLRRGRGTWPSRKQRVVRYRRKNVVIRKVVLDRVAEKYLRNTARNPLQ